MSGAAGKGCGLAVVCELKISDGPLVLGSSMLAVGATPGAPGEACGSTDACELMFLCCSWGGLLVSRGSLMLDSSLPARAGAG